MDKNPRRQFQIAVLYFTHRDMIYFTLFIDFAIET